MIQVFAVIVVFALGSTATGDETVKCEFTFAERPACRHGPYRVAIESESVAADERLLEALNVTHGDRRQRLEVTPDTTLIEGDRGYISFRDINFDGTPDLAVTTSFGVANLYLDYWVYDNAEDRFVFAGNYARLSPDAATRTLHNTVKINAAEYEKNTYIWEGNKLKEKK